MTKISRKDFVSLEYFKDAEKDCAIPIGFGVTSSRPSTVNNLVQHLIKDCPSFDTVLEIGTGCGYQTAILSTLFKKVYSIEIIPELALRADRTLKSLGYKNIDVICANVFALPFNKQFNAIIAGTDLPYLPLDLKADVMVLPINGLLLKITPNNPPQELPGRCGFSNARIK